jgi:hypothetical protein
MTLAEIIKQRYQRGIGAEPPRSGVALLPSRETDIQKIERLFLQTAMTYSHSRRATGVSGNVGQATRKLGISYTKIDNSTYQVSAHILPFIVKKENAYYHFGAAEIAVDIRFNGDYSEIVDRSRVVNLPYEHPFVFCDGDICVGELDWVADRGIRFGYLYHLSGLVPMAGRIAYVLADGKRTLESGYIGENITPVNDITDYRPVAWRKEAAEGYAIKNGIRLTRIFDNDKR